MRFTGIFGVVILLFIALELGSELSPLIAALFVCGMLSLIASLVCFLKEISLATWRLEAAFDADLPPDTPRRPTASLSPAFGVDGAPMFRGLTVPGVAHGTAGSCSPA